MPLCVIAWNSAWRRRAPVKTPEVVRRASSADVVPTRGTQAASPRPCQGRAASGARPRTRASRFGAPRSDDPAPVDRGPAGATSGLSRGAIDVARRRAGDAASGSAPALRSSAQPGGETRGSLPTCVTRGGRVAATVALHPIGFVCHLDAETVARVRAQSRMVRVAGSPSRWSCVSAVLPPTTRCNAPSRTSARTSAAAVKSRSGSPASFASTAWSCSPGWLAVGACGNDPRVGPRRARAVRRNAPGPAQRVRRPRGWCGGCGYWSSAASSARISSEAI